METPSIKVFVPPFDGEMRAQRSRKIYRSYARSPEYFDGIAGVQIGPGATLFTRTPSAVHARESECVKMLIALWLEEKSSHWVDILRAKAAFASSARAVPVTRTFF